MTELHSNKEIYDYVVNNLRQQGRPSMDQWGEGCLYRNSEGLKCAAGWLIPDHLYSKGMEVLIVGENPLLDSLLTGFGYDLQFVRDLQYCHDNAGHWSTNYGLEPLNLEKFHSRLEKNLQDMAKKYDLNTEVLHA